MYIRDWVTVAGYRLHTSTVHFDRATQDGFLGRCTYVLLESCKGAKHDAIQSILAGEELKPIQALSLLSNFAHYAGIGYKTTMGMGQVRVSTPREAAFPRDAQRAFLTEQEKRKTGAGPKKCDSL